MKKPARNTNPRYAILLDVIRLAKAIVTKCNREKVLRPTLVWQVALLARATNAARSASLLIQNGVTAETKLINRALLDTMIDTLFIIEHPERSRTILRALKIESIVDRYEHVKFLAGVAEEPIDVYAARSQPVQRVVDAFREIARDPLFKYSNRKLAIWDRRWMHISIQEKFKSLPKVPTMFSAFNYTVRFAGNAVAHNRPSALVSLLYSKHDGSIGIHLTQERINFTETVDFCAFESCLLLLVICDAIIDDLFLGGRLKSRLNRLTERLKTVGRDHPIHLSMPRGKRRILI